MRPRPLLASAAAALALLSACATPEALPEPSPVTAAPADRGALLPVRWRDTYAVVEAFVDGRGPFTFVLDTGASHCVVGTEVAASHPGDSRTFEEPRTFDEASGEGVSVGGAIRIGSLRTGEFEFRAVEAPVLDLGFLSVAMGIRIDGILGISLFADGLLTLDYPAREVRFGPGELPPVDGSDVIPLVMDGYPLVDLLWNGEPVRVILDSGNNGGIRLNDWPRAAEFLSGPVEDRSATSVTGATVRSASARVKGTLGLGRFRIPDPVLRVGPGPPTLGTEILGRLRITLDVAHGRVRFEGDSPEIPMASVRGIGATVAPSKAGFAVREVRPGFPAETAGIRAGDVLLRVDGLPADLEHWREISEATRREGHRVRVDVRRGAEDLRFEVPVVDIIR